MLFLLLILFLISFFVTFFAVPVLISYCTKKKIGGNDVNKEGRPFVPGLGGLSIVLALLVSLVFLFFLSSSSGMQSFLGVSLDSRSSSIVLATTAVLLIAAAIGLIDDFVSIPHKVKLLLPILISVPIILVKMSGVAVLSIPLIGQLAFIPPIVYLLVLIPVGVMAVTNVTNTFAGFNGLEAGLASVVVFFLLLISFAQNETSIFLVCIPFLGALLAFILYNWYPARIFIDDVGTLAIGAVLSSAIILGSLEFIGAILLLPYIIDFLFFKIPNRLPSTKWWPEVRGNRLYFSGKPIHFGQWAVKHIGGEKGITEQNLVMFFIFFGIVLGVVALFFAGLI